MIYEESFATVGDEVLSLIKKAIPGSFTKNLKDAGLELAFPNDRDLELKVKFDISEFGGACSLKVTWDGDVEEEDDEEEEIEDENED